MAKVRTLSRTFMKGHPRAGEPTYFVEKAFNSIGYSNIKYLKEMNPNTDLKILQTVCDLFNEDIEETKPHTIRMGRHFKPVDELTLAVWSDKPYRSKQIKLWTGPIRAIDIIIFSSNSGLIWVANEYTGKKLDIPTLAKNDGLNEGDFKIWFKVKGKVCKELEAQILIWNPEINY